MSIMVPGRGWCTNVYGTGINEDFVLLGPFSEGTWVERLDVAMSTNGDTIVQFGASIGGSGEATVAAFRAGLSLLQRSTITFHGQPTTGWNTGGAGASRMIIPVGVKVSSGSRWIVCRVQGTVALVSYSVTVGARVVELLGVD